jgi:hypothetical protein
MSKHNRERREFRRLVKAIGVTAARDLPNAARIFTRLSKHGKRKLARQH